MDCCVKAYFRREERYEGLQVVFYKDKIDREKIEKVIDDAKAKFELDPKVFENCYADEPNKCAFYIEFEDDYDRIAGEFFEYILKELDVKKCE